MCFPAGKPSQADVGSALLHSDVYVRPALLVLTYPVQLGVAQRQRLQPVGTQHYVPAGLAFVAVDQPSDC